MNDNTVKLQIEMPEWLYKFYMTSPDIGTNDECIPDATRHVIKKAKNIVSGKWIKEFDNTYAISMYHCSVCNRKLVILNKDESLKDYPYCHCGAYMLNDDKFIEIPKYGILYYERKLFESYIPIIFVCKNEDGERFLVVCCRTNGRKYLITKTTPNTIIRMLENVITIRDALLEDESFRLSITIGFDGNTDFVENDEHDWGENSTELPVKGMFMDADDGEFDEEIQYYLGEK